MMSLNWFTGLITWIAMGEMPAELIEVFDCFNASQGIIILFLFVFIKKSGIKCCKQNVEEGDPQYQQVPHK